MLLRPKSVGAGGKTLLFSRKMRYNNYYILFSIWHQHEKGMDSMIKMETPLGAVEISQDYFANLVGHAASECFGVAGMIESTASQGLRYILRKEEKDDKGVKVRYGANGLIIDLHIAVTYGVNISAIVKSIVNKVSYTVQEATGFQVAKVNVFVDDMKQ